MPIQVESQLSALSLRILVLGLVFACGYLFARRLHQRKTERWRRSFASMEAANEGLKAAMESLEQAVGTDRLTGAWNRRRFEEAASAEISLARRRKEPVSLLMLDLDHFKRINDSFGHETGDAVLVAATSTWRKVLRASDPLVRWGGEEFIVLSPTNRLDGAMTLATKLGDALRSLPFPEVGPVTVSIGVAEFAPGETLETWIQRADQALYRAKAEGRDRVVAAEGPAGDTLELTPILELLWEESLTCGQPVIDEQHRRLFDLANALLTALTLDFPKEEVALRWNRLLAHSAQHFHDEERILARTGYPDLVHHADEHQRLLATAREIQASVSEGRMDLGRVVNFLAMDLVKGHLMQEDSAYFKDLPADSGAIT